MEKPDKELLFKIIATNPTLKELYNEHLKLDKEVRKYSRYTACSSFAVTRQNALKREKLKTKDSILEILNEYRQGEAEAA